MASAMIKISSVHLYGYISRISRLRQREGYSHSVIGYKTKTPLLACGMPSVNLSWTLEAEAPTEKCPHCEKEIGRLKSLGLL